MHLFKDCWSSPTISAILLLVLQNITFVKGMKSLVGLIISAALIFNGLLAAQQDSVQIKVSKDKVKISGKLYYIHTVRAGETLYTIAKAYQVAQAAIVEANPELYQGIKAGNTLKVPVVQELSNPNQNKGTFHIVKKGETLYSIAKQYKVPTDVLVKINMLEAGAVQENQALIIPSVSSKEPQKSFDTSVSTSSASRNSTVSQKNVVEREAKPSAQKESLSIVGQKGVETLQHEVVAKETLSSLARKYGITIDEILEANPVLKEEGLKIGQVLVVKIPKGKKSSSEPQEAKPTVEVFNGDCPKYSYKTSTAFNVVLMLPFGGEGMLADTSSSNGKRAEDIIQYYEGTLVAIDSLKQSGVSVNLTVLDTKNDKDADVVAKALKHPSLKNADLIIGPVYPEAVSLVAKFAEAKHIPMVSPLASNAQALKGNPYYIQVAPEAEVLTSLSVEFAKKKDGKTILVVPSDGSDAKFVKEFKSQLKEKLPELSYKQGNPAATQREALKSKLSESGKTRFVVLSNNEVFVLDFLQNLSSAAKDANIEVLGTQKWLKFNSIDVQYLHSVNVEMFVGNYADYGVETTKSFVRSFRSYFNAEPNNYAFRGFDVAYFFVGAMKKYGPEFIGCLPKLTAKNIHTPFRFEKQGDGGFSNTDAAMIKHVEDFKVTRTR